MVQEITTTEKQGLLKHYEQDIIGFLQQDNQPDDLDGELVCRYVEFLRQERGHKQATIRQRPVTLRAFANWLRKSDHNQNDPFAELEFDLRPPRPSCSTSSGWRVKTPTTETTFSSAKTVGA